MKKLIAAATGIIVALTASSQFVGVGIRAGLNLQNITGKNSDGVKHDNNIKTGFHAGIVVDLALGSDFFLEPGVIYTQKGADLEQYKYMDHIHDGKITLSYLDIPVSVTYKPALGKGRIVLGAGPYIGIGIDGDREKGEPVEFKGDIEISDLSKTTYYYRTLDAGANIFAGYEINNKFLLQVQGQFGLKKINAKINGEEMGEDSHKHTGFGISLGYKIK
jgi:hypothetical protein